MGVRIHRVFGAALFAAIPMAGAAIGAMLDERHHLGFTTWRSVCRARGLRLGTLADFTLQLLPLAVIGLLLGGLTVLAVGLLYRRNLASTCVAAHAGCALVLPVTLVFCALLSTGWMLIADLVLATLAALAIVRVNPVTHDPAASVRLLTRAAPRA